MMMHLYKLLDEAYSRLNAKDPVYNEKADLVLAILRSKGAVPYKRSALNGHVHTQFAGAIVCAHERDATMDITTRRAGNLHEAGYSTRILHYLDQAVKHGLLLSGTKKAEGALILGSILTTYLDHSLVSDTFLNA